MFEASFISQQSVSLRYSLYKQFSGNFAARIKSIRKFSVPQIVTPKLLYSLPLFFAVCLNTLPSPSK